MPTSPLQPHETYLHLAADGTATALAGGERFWSQPAEALERHGLGWLVSEYEVSTDWPNWEMHPAGDELVYVLSGAARLLLEQPDGVEEVVVIGPGLVVVPRGVWHTARVAQPTRFLHVTRGAGTRHRAVG